MFSKFAPRIDGFYDPTTQIHRNITRRAEAYLERGNQFRNALKTPADAAAWVRRTRGMFAAGIGGLPKEKCPLAARVTGVVDQPDYTVEKVIFQSLPGMWVTANFYLPKNRVGKVPGVTVYCGHAGTAKASYQGVAGLIAQNGMAALIVDPLGQGERVNFIDRDSGAQVVPWTTRDHTHLGLLSTLLGQNISRYFINDNLRAVDYLLSRPEIDKTRIAATGNSGGGTQTTYQCLFDPRLAAAAPSCYVNARREFLVCRNPHDAEQNTFGTFPNMIDMPDMLMGIAPKPLLLLSAAYDFFPNEGTRWTFEQLQKVYEMHGKPGNVEWFVDNVTHGFSHGLRCAMVKFFNKHLVGKPENSLKLTPSPIIPDEQLQCTRTGQVLTDFPDDKSLYERNLAQIPAKYTITPKALQLKVRGLINNQRSAAPLHARIIESKQDLAIHMERLFFFSEKDIALTAKVAKPARATGRLAATILLLPEGTDGSCEYDFLPRYATLWTPNRLLMVLDVRGVGAVKSDYVNEGDDKSVYGTKFMHSYNTWMLGDNFVCARAFDVQQAIEYLRSRPDVDADQISIVAEGEPAMPGLLAAVADGKITNVNCEGLPASFKAELSKVYYDRRKVSEFNAIHGMLLDFDLPELFAALGVAKPGGKSKSKNQGKGKKQKGA